MTMTRTEKASHARELETARQTGYTAAQFASPRLYFPAKAERGHARMTAAEYREHRMTRGQMTRSRLDLRIEQRQAAKARHRRTRPTRVA
jgi:hypothetical protein